MRDKELKSRGGAATGGSHAVEVKAAMNEFLSEFSGFKNEIKSKLNELEDRLNMFNAKSLSTSRPVLSTSAEVGIPHKKAFSAYLRSGDDDALRGLPVEEKSLSTARMVMPITGVGVSSWSLGVSGAIDRYGSGLGLGSNSYAKGMTGPLVYWAGTPLELTADAGTFDGGTVRLAVHYVELNPPRAV